MNRQEKGVIIADLKEKFSKAKAVVLTDYKGMSVAELTELRILLNKSSLDYGVVKNTLAKIAAKETGVDSASAYFKGPVGVAIGYDDPVMVVKKVLEFSKGNDKLKVQGAVVEGRFCDQSQLKEIADLPSREVLLSMLAGVMQAPASKLVRTMNATVVNFAYALDALSKKKTD